MTTCPTSEVKWFACYHERPKAQYSLDVEMVSLASYTNEINDEHEGPDSVHQKYAALHRWIATLHRLIAKCECCVADADAVFYDMTKSRVASAGNLLHYPMSVSTNQRIHERSVITCPCYCDSEKSINNMVLYMYIETTTVSCLYYTISLTASNGQLQLRLRVRGYCAAIF